MAVQLIHVSDIHFGSGEAHGRINPDTGLNVRFEDFVSALAKVVDYSLQHKIDIFLFSGDAYRHASPEPIYQKLFAQQLKRLSAADIKTVLVVGNHDQLLKSTASHAMSVFQSLEVPGLITVDRPMSCHIHTKGGIVQLIGLPHINRHQLMTLEKYANTGAAAIDRLLVDHVGDLLRSYYDGLDPSIPAVVTAHMTVDKALAGIEQELLIGYTMTFPTDIFIDKRIDYVALGHVHKHQIIRDKDPAIVYAGSLERIDFGEENEDKGFVHVCLERKQTTYQFHSIKPRPFVTIDVDCTGSDDPTRALAEKISSTIVAGCVMRVRYKVDQQQLSNIDEDILRTLAKDALSLRLQPELVGRENRARIPQITQATAASPLVALDTYLSEVAPDRKDRLLEKARQLAEEANASELN
jgi:exonuclease SbcD